MFSEMPGGPHVCSVSLMFVLFPSLTIGTWIHDQPPKLPSACSLSQPVHLSSSTSTLALLPLTTRLLSQLPWWSRFQGPFTALVTNACAHCCFLYPGIITFPAACSPLHGPASHTHKLTSFMLNLTLTSINK